MRTRPRRPKAPAGRGTCRSPTHTGPASRRPAALLALAASGSSVTALHKNRRELDRLGFFCPVAKAVMIGRYQVQTPAYCYKCMVGVLEKGLYYHDLFR